MTRTATLETLELRLLWSAASPSGAEQQTLELINRMRQNPAAELPLIENSTDPAVQEAFQFFNVNKTVLASQWATLVPVPPLAWNADLAAAALGHDKLMLADNTQSHQLPGESDLPTRVTAAGYTPYSTLEESVFASATSVFDAHASFAIDFGNTPTGIQDPPGHRENIMAAGVTEVGIASISGPGTGTGNPVGPLLFTEDFGSRFDSGNPFLLGSVFDDTNGDGFYTAGEGIGGVAVHIAGIDGTTGTFDTSTLSAGGYQIQVPAGTYTMTFSGGGLASPITRTGVVVGTSNVQEDVNTAPTPPRITSSADDAFTTGTSATFTVTSTGSPTASLSEIGALPSGITFTDNGDGTATLAGTPAAGTGAIYVLTFKAKNGDKPNGKQSFTLTIDQAPAITSANTTSFTVGTAGKFTITTTAFPTAAITEKGALPTGITFIDKGNGNAKLHGTPAAGTAGTYPITIKAKNGVSPKAIESFSLVVSDAVAPADASATLDGQPGDAIVDGDDNTTQMDLGCNAMPGVADTLFGQSRLLG